MKIIKSKVLFFKLIKTALKYYFDYNIGINYK